MYLRKWFVLHFTHPPSELRIYSKHRSSFIAIDAWARTELTLEDAHTQSAVALFCSLTTSRRTHTPQHQRESSIFKSKFVAIFARNDAHCILMLSL